MCTWDLYDYILSDSDADGKLLDTQWLDKARAFSAQSVHAVTWLHAQKIVHRDIKPENILLKKGTGGEFHIALSDMGTAKDFAKEQPKTWRRGTPGFCAPEVEAKLYVDDEEDERAENPN